MPFYWCLKKWRGHLSLDKHHLKQLSLMVEVDFKGSPICQQVSGINLYIYGAPLNVINIWIIIKLLHMNYVYAVFKYQ